MTAPLSFALVVIKTAHGERNITSVRAALEMLNGDWPPKKGRGLAWRAAMRSCLAALEGKATVESARMAFIRAAVEARNLVRTVEPK
jgi:Protein of unknown function (DUF982)